MKAVEKPADKKLAYSTDLEKSAAAAAPAAQDDRGGRGQGGRGQGGRGQGGRGQGGRKPRTKPEADASGLIESVIRIARVAKVTKGGTKMSFSALVVVGDGKGNAGYALGKANEVAVGIKKALNAAKKRMVPINRHGTTIPHVVIGKWCATEVLLKPASEGTGVIACGPVRAICDGAGIKNILTKVHRSSNPLNVVKATFEGFSRLKMVKTIEVSESK
ncbi:MAG: 30S ribosomal protein S5 [Candidatus Omnitrophica bacterium]|nr:30S ribosomal protein S5 [Candidatus Omnitrophota bacterium]